MAIPPRPEGRGLLANLDEDMLKTLTEQNASLIKEVEKNKEEIDDLRRRIT